jgi:hypothetical protein
MQVETEAGEPLGRLFDFRCDRPPGKRGNPREPRVIQLVYGTVGLLERLGLRTARECEVGWSDVVAIRGDRIIVRMPESKPGSKLK